MAVRQGPEVEQRQLDGHVMLDPVLLVNIIIIVTMMPNSKIVVYRFTALCRVDPTLASLPIIRPTEPDNNVL